MLKLLPISVKADIFPIFQSPMLSWFLKFIIFSSFDCFLLFVSIFYVGRLANLLMPIGKLYFPTSNCNVFVFVTLAYVISFGILL